jgi:hypothetical protein
LLLRQFSSESNSYGIESRTYLRDSSSTSVFWRKQADREVPLFRNVPDLPRGPGSHEITWDGEDNRRWRVAAGKYLFRLRHGDDARSGAVTYVP